MVRKVAIGTVLVMLICSIQFTLPVIAADYSELESALTLARELLDHSEEGMSTGMYPPSAFTMLRDSYEEAYLGINNVNQSEVDSKTYILNQAIDLFKGSSIISATEEIVSEDFENFVPGKYYIQNGNVDAEKYPDNAVFYLNNSGSRARFMDAVQTDANIATVKISFMQTEKSKIQNILQIGDNEGKKHATLVYSDGENIVAGYGGTNNYNSYLKRVLVENYESDIWYTIVVTTYLDEKEFTIEVLTENESVTQTEKLQFWYTTVGDVSRANVQIDTVGSDMYIDNFKRYVRKPDISVVNSIDLDCQAVYEIPDNSVLSINPVAVVYDQYGNPMDGNVILSLENSIAGISLNDKTITVDSGVETCLVTLTAKSDNGKYEKSNIVLLGKTMKIETVKTTGSILKIFGIIPYAENRIANIYTDSSLIEKRYVQIDESCVFETELIVPAGFKSQDVNIYLACDGFDTVQTKVRYYGEDAAGFAIDMLNNAVNIIEVENIIEEYKTYLGINLPESYHENTKIFCREILEADFTDSNELSRIINLLDLFLKIEVSEIEEIANLLNRNFNLLINSGVNLKLEQLNNKQILRISAELYTIKYSPEVGVNELIETINLAIDNMSADNDETITSKYDSLNIALTAARSLLESAKEGNSIGMYPNSSFTMLRDAYNKGIYKVGSIDSEEADKRRNNIENAISLFKGTIISSQFVARHTEGFDKYTGSGYYAKNVSVEQENGNNILLLSCDTSTSRLMHQSMPGTRISASEVSFKQDVKGKIENIMLISDSSGNSHAALVYSDGKDIVVRYGGGAGGVGYKEIPLLENYEARKWYTIFMVVSLDAQTFRVSISSGNITLSETQPLNFWFEDINSTDGVSRYNSQINTLGSQMYIDNLIRYDVIRKEAVVNSVDISVPEFVLVPLADAVSVIPSSVVRDQYFEEMIEENIVYSLENCPQGVHLKDGQIVVEPGVKSCKIILKAMTEDGIYNKRTIVIAEQNSISLMSISIHNGIIYADGIISSNEPKAIELYTNIASVSKVQVQSEGNGTFAAELILPINLLTQEITVTAKNDDVGSITGMVQYYGKDAVDIAVRLISQAKDVVAVESILEEYENSLGITLSNLYYANKDIYCYEILHGDVDSPDSLYNIIDMLELFMSLENSDRLSIKKLLGESIDLLVNNGADQRIKGIVNTAQFESLCVKVLGIKYEKLSGINKLISEINKGIEEVLKRDDKDNNEKLPSGDHRGTGLAGNTGKVDINYEINNQTEKEKNNSNYFRDIDGYEWANQYITYLSAKGIVVGNDGLFRPGQCVTRAEFMKMLISAIGIESNGEKRQIFTDTPKDAWWADYAESAVEASIINGYPDGSFKPDSWIIRQDMAVMAQRAIRYSIVNVDFGTVEPAFKDVAEISEYAQDSVSLMRSLGIVNGKENNTFAPNDYLTRAEAAKVIYKILRLKEEGI